MDLRFSPVNEDPLVPLGLVAVRTKRIGVATTVLTPLQRSAMMAAAGIATIAWLSGSPFLEDGICTCTTV